jgi:hypothetical protein
MAERATGDRLEAVLGSIAAHLVIEPDVDVAADQARDGPREPIAGRSSAATRWRRPLLAAALVVAVVAGAVLAIAPARRVVSGWLHAGPIDVGIDPDVTVGPALPTFVDGSSPLTVDQLENALGGPVPEVSTTVLGEPDGWWWPPERGVLATWNLGETSLWMVRAEDTFPERLEKWLPDAGWAEPLPQLGDGGYAVAREHVMDTPYRRLAARNVVAWEAGGIVFRLDSSLTRDQLVAIAEAIATAQT